MARRSVLAVFFLILSTSFTYFACKGRGPTLVRVGGETITEGDLDVLTRVNPRLKPRLATPDGKQRILENYVEQELLYQESLRRGLQRTGPVKDKLDLYGKIIVAQALLDDELDKKVKEYYQNHRDEFERIKVSHIMIRTAPSEEAKSSQKGRKREMIHPETEALRLVENIRDRLTKGEDFSKLAKEASEDDRTKNIQGDLGYITLRDKRLERWGWLPLAEKAFAMKAGEFSDAIKTKEGFHVIKVTEDRKLGPLEDAEPGIRFRLQADIRTQLLDDLKKRYKVEFAKGGSPAAPTPPPTMPPPSTQPSAPAAPVPTGTQ